MYHLETIINVEGEDIQYESTYKDFCDLHLLANVMAECHMILPSIAELN